VLFRSASAVQIGSGIGRKGLAVFREVCAGLGSFMSEQGFATIKSMVGAAHE
jgi:dihydroorotate dehydrogenase (NAD+) catalytic subunit